MALVLYLFGGLGITAGYHRLFAHKAYKATPFLKYWLLFWGTVAAQGSALKWCRDHRVHHPYSETDADPHNAERGFFFSHVGWLFVSKHKDVIEAGKRVDMSDLYSDPVLRLQDKIYVPLVLFVTYVLPTVAGGLFFGSYWYAYWVACSFRVIFVLNTTWFVNSIAHFWGERTYDEFVAGTENLFVSLLTLGEGHHSFHHKWAWDWKAGEHCWRAYNPTAWFIKMCSILGLAYDLKEVDANSVQKQKNKGLKRSIDHMKKVIEEKSEKIKASGTEEMQKKADEKTKEILGAIDLLKVEVQKRIDSGAEQFGSMRRRMQSKLNTIRNQVDHFEQTLVQ